MTTADFDKEAAARSALEDCVKTRKIFIDTCSLLHFASVPFWDNVIPLLRQHSAKIIVPLRVVDEVKEKIKDDKIGAKATEAYNRLCQLAGSDLITVKGEETDNFADNVFHTVFSKFRMTHHLLLITQDKNLAQDILQLNNSKSVKANKIYVKRINQYGYLSNFFFEDSETPKAASSDRDEDPPEDESFRLCSEVTAIEDTPLTISHIPGESETVYTSHGPIQILEKIAAGGEGVIYKTSTPYVAKIYKKEKNTKRKYEKIKLMISKGVACDGICFPIDALYNSDMEFVGYLMPEAKGKTLQRSLFIKKLLFQNFPDWRKRDTVELCLTILNKIKYLHERNIIMGDINPANIMVVSTKEVYFVDTDSYQIEDIPCPVGTINYTAPEIQGKHFSDFLRTLGNENFAVATLLFMIMLPGKPPYSQQGGEDPISNIVNMDFSYPFGENSNKKTPDGPWRYIWSHLTFDIKGAFYQTFRRDGERSAENDRLGVDEWIGKFKYYLKLLDEGTLGQQDTMSEELFPTRHKKDRNKTYTICRLCGNEAAEEYCQSGICRECLNLGEIYHCKECGKELCYTNYQKYIKGTPRHEICRECHEQGNMEFMSRECIDCGARFTITFRQYRSFQDKGFDIPKRCANCRAARKIQRIAEANYDDYRHYSKPVDSTPPAQPSQNSSSSGSLCYITTAVCEFYNKPDNCPELETLRKFRDTWLHSQPDGPALIARYYREAPAIVTNLKASSRYAEYCQTLWGDYISPCLDLIGENQFEACKQKYIAMVNYIAGELL